MAIYHFSAKVIGRSAGRSAIASAAYRAAERLHDDKLDRDHDYTLKAGVVHREILLPEGAPERWLDRGTLWNEVEASEKRKDAQLARDIEISLPRELGQAEAIRLARTLNELMPDSPETMGLLALMILHHSRRDARCNEAGDLVTLEEQDRSRWRHDEIGEGVQVLLRALGRRSPGSYQLQAATAALHAEARSERDTDWKQIASLYAVLAVMYPSPVVSLNHAVAVAMSEGLQIGLEMLDALGADPDIRSYHLFHAARADLLRRLGRTIEARESYERALSLTANAVEQRYLRRRIDQLTITGI